MDKFFWLERGYRKRIIQILGVQFCLDIDTNDVDEFLIKKHLRFFLILGTFMAGLTVSVLIQSGFIQFLNKTRVP